MVKDIFGCHPSQFNIIYRLSPSISFTRLLNKKQSNTNSSALCSLLIPISWTSSALVSCLSCGILPASYRCGFNPNRQFSLVRSLFGSCLPRFFLGCFNITTVFSHAQTVVVCTSCTSVLCQPTGGKARLTEGSSPCVPPTMPVY